MLIGVTLLAFFLLRLSPVDPAEAYIRRTVFNPTPEQIEMARESMGYDRPIYEQYVSWIAGCLRGDFGMSLLTRNPVGADLLRRLPVTLSVVGLSVLWTAALTIAANIRFGRPDATDEEVREAAKKARCHEFIMALPDGYGTMIGEGGSTLSGGERQRISIARAILKDAPIVLLDEATASVDPDNEKHIQQAINELVKDKTLILIAHRLSTIKNADQILVIDDGRLVQRGTHDELIAEGGQYGNLWRRRINARSWKIATRA